MDQLTVISALSMTPKIKMRIGKTFYLDGSISHKMKIKYWEVETIPITGIESLYSVLKEITIRGYSAIVRGKFVGANPAHTARDNSTFKSVPRNWIMIDIDDLIAPDDMDPTSSDAVNFAISKLPAPFHNADYIVHFSSSAGQAGQKIKVHLFFWLETPEVDVNLKKWAKPLKHLIDYSVFQQVQPHFVSDPKFEDPDMDPFQDRSRLYLVKGNRRTVSGGGVGKAFRNPSNSNNHYESEGFLNGSPRPSHPPPTGERLRDEREKLLVRIRYHYMRKGCDSFENFVHAVWEEFQKRAVLEENELSETVWDYDKVWQKCEHDRDKLANFISRSIQIPTQFWERSEAQNALKKHLSNFMETPCNFLIKAEAGLGKSSSARSALIKSVGIKSKNIEIYAPTKKLSKEWGEELSKAEPNLDVRLIVGRNNENCNKFDLFREIAALGDGATHRICHNPDKKESCEFWGKCGWSQQDVNDRPAIRIMAHSYLNLPRPSKTPHPDFIIVDESIHSQQVSHTELNVDRLTSMRGYKAFLSNRKFTAPKTPDFQSDTVVEEDKGELIRIGGIVAEALTRELPLLGHLRSQNITKMHVARCQRAIGAFTTYIDISPSQTESKMKGAMSRAESSHSKELKALIELYRLLEIELDRERDNSRTVSFKHDIVGLHKRAELIRLKDVKTLFLDADGEREILAKNIPDIKEIKLSVRYNAEVWQVADRTFSKSSLGLNEDKSPHLFDQVTHYISRIEAPEKTLIVTYKDFQKILTTNGEGFSKTKNGVTVGHFGNIRGFDDYKNFEKIVVIGRYQRPSYVIGMDCRALTFDEDAEPTKELDDAVYRALITSETNQAVARLRLIWNEKLKKVILFSSEPVPFPVDHKMSWNDFSNDGSRLHHLQQKFGVVPLVAKWLYKNANDLFSNEHAAAKWIENTFPPGTENGKFRLKGVRGKHQRFMADDFVLNPKKALELLVGTLSHYEGPTPGIKMDGRILRLVFEDHNLKPLLDTGIFYVPALPKPGQKNHLNQASFYGFIFK